MSPQAAARISRAKKTAALPISLARPASGWISHADAVDDSLNGRIENFNQQKQEHRDDEKRFFWQGYRRKKCRGDEDHGQKELFHGRPLRAQDPRGFL